jgi:DNA-binding NarL/FixJ family response regulator
VKATTTIRVMIVEDHRMVSDGISFLLNDQPDMTVVGSAGSVAEAAPLAEEQSPDVVLMDFRLPDGTGSDAGVRIREVMPRVKLIFVSRDDSDIARIAALEAGASAFLHKSRAAAELVDAVRTVAAGTTLITPRAIATLLSTRNAATAQLQSLTQRERDVLRLVAVGMPSRDIARRLGISYTTVRTHIRSLGRKLGVHSKLAAANRARDLGLVD